MLFLTIFCKVLHQSPVQTSIIQHKFPNYCMSISLSHLTLTVPSLMGLLLFLSTWWTLILVSSKLWFLLFDSNFTSIAQLWQNWALFPNSTDNCRVGGQVHDDEKYIMYSSMHAVQMGGSSIGPASASVHLKYFFKKLLGTEYKK